MSYNSDATRNFAQRNKSGKPKEWGKDYTARSYTFNHRTYKDAADKDARIMVRNLEGERNIWEVRLSIRAKLSDKEHLAIWKHFCRAIKKAGLEVSGAREFEETELHYHLAGIPAITPPNNIFWNIGIAAITPNWNKQRRIIRQCIPEWIRKKCEVHIKPVESIEGYCRYIVKAETMITDILGNRVDANAKDRRLYPKETSLHKIVSTRGFWRKPKKVLWQEIVEENKTKSDSSNSEQKELKQFQSKVDHHILTLATPEQHQTATKLFNLVPQIQERTILLNLVWSNLDDDTLEAIRKRYRPKQYPDDDELPKIVLGNYDDIDERQETLEGIIGGSVIERA